MRSADGAKRSRLCSIIYALGKAKARIPLGNPSLHPLAPTSAHTDFSDSRAPFEAGASSSERQLVGGGVFASFCAMAST